MGIVGIVLKIVAILVVIIIAIIVIAVISIASTVDTITDTGTDTSTDTVTETITDTVVDTIKEGRIESTKIIEQSVKEPISEYSRHSQIMEQLDGGGGAIQAQVGAYLGYCDTSWKISLDGSASKLDCYDKVAHKFGLE